MNRSAETAALAVAFVAVLTLSSDVAAAPAWPGAPAVPTRDVATAEAVTLIRAAIDDPTALAELREVDHVDGRPVDMQAVTDGLGVDRRERLTALAEQLDPSGEPPAPSGTGTTAEARESAEAVLDADKYHENRLPQPFRGPFTWVADRLAAVGDRLQPLFDNPVTAVLFLVAASGLIVFAVVTLVRRRVRAAVHQTERGSGLVDTDLDPADLDRSADDAEAAGAFVDAVRLRYEAGLLRLVRDGRLGLRPDTTARGAAQQIGESAMDHLTDTFEAVVYGGREATSTDVAEARSGWLELLGAKARR